MAETRPIDRTVLPVLQCEQDSSAQEEDQPHCLPTRQPSLGGSQKQLQPNGKWHKWHRDDHWAGVTESRHHNATQQKQQEKPKKQDNKAREAGLTVVTVSQSAPVRWTRRSTRIVDIGVQTSIMHSPNDQCSVARAEKALGTS